MIAAYGSVFCLFLTLSKGITTAEPLNPEDLESLLPPTPQTKNETIAAVVQDPVVQDAVHQAANNGSLNGLVVKKKVYILPATNPNTILSNREQLFVVPTENLEDVRRNITETKEAEAEAVASVSPESESLEGNAEDGYMPEGNESGPQRYTAEVETFSEGNTAESIPLSEKRKTETEFLEDKFSGDARLPEDDSKKVAVPIVAVIDPANAEKGKANGPVVAILPNGLNHNDLNDQVRYLKIHSEHIQKKAQEYIDETSVTVNPEDWKASTPLETTVDSTPAQGTVPESPSVDQGTRKTATESLTPFLVPRWEMLAPVFPDESALYPKTGDMDVAEDIIFRPLFRYRQETQERSKYRDDAYNRRYSYGSYRPYGYYPRRNYYYRSQYDDY